MRETVIRLPDQRELKVKNSSGIPIILERTVDTLDMRVTIEHNLINSITYEARPRNFDPALSMLPRSLRWKYAGGSMYIVLSYIEV